jgi:hypothetical protein
MQKSLLMPGNRRSEIETIKLKQDLSGFIQIQGDTLVSVGDNQVAILKNTLVSVVHFTKVRLKKSSPPKRACNYSRIRQ